MVPIIIQITSSQTTLPKISGRFDGLAIQICWWVC